MCHVCNMYRVQYTHERTHTHINAHPSTFTAIYYLYLYLLRLCGRGGVKVSGRRRTSDWRMQGNGARGSEKGIYRERHRREKGIRGGQGRKERVGVLAFFFK